MDSCSNDVMNHVDCIINHDVYQQKMHSRSENIHGISFLAHLSTKCSKMSFCDCPMSGVCRLMCVVCRPQFLLTSPPPKPLGQS